MGLLKKKKNQKDETNIAQENKMTIGETQQKLENARITLDDLIAELRNIQQQSVQEEILKAALKNDAKLKKWQDEGMADAVKEAEESGKKILNKENLEQGLYIYSNELNKYNAALNTVIKYFGEISAADTVSAGAEEIDVYLKEYILKLKKALMEGQKLKANACLDALRYAVKVVYTTDDFVNEKVSREFKEEKIAFVSGTCRDLLSSIDAYYGRLKDLDLEEEEYAKAYEKFMEIDKRMEEIPEKHKYKLDTLGFKRAMEELPAGDETRNYFPIIFAGSSSVTQLEYTSLTLESLSNAVQQLKTDIDELTAQCRRVFNIQGRDFDIIEHQKQIQMIRNRGIERINSLQDEVSKAVDMNKELDSLVSEAAANINLGKAIFDSNQMMKKMSNLIKKNETMKEEAAAQKEKVEKQREEEEAQKIFESKEELIEDQWLEPEKELADI